MTESLEDTNIVQLRQEGAHSSFGSVMVEFTLLVMEYGNSWAWGF